MSEKRETDTPDTPDETDKTVASDEATDAEDGPSRGFVSANAPFLLAALLAIAALVLLVVKPSGDDTTNVAVVDSRTTAQLVDAVTNGLEGSFAYDFRDPGKSERVADDFFTGGAVDDYATLRKSVATLGADQSLVYETDVSQVGVQELDGSKATVLAFVDQTSTRGTDGAVQEAPAQVVLDLERVDGTWKASSLDLL